MQNLILLGMSTLPNNPQKSNFLMKDDPSIEVKECIGQLEPIVKLFIQENKNDNLKIVSICSKETLEVGDNGRGSAYDFFKDRIQEYLKKENLNENQVQHEKIEIEDLNNMEASINQAVKIIRKWNEEQNGKAKLWIDNHGGLRELSILMNAIVSLLKIDGIQPEYIYSTEMDYKEGKHYIIDTTKLINVFDFVSGINAFINFGDATILSEWYAENDNESIKEIIKSMNIIQEGTKICDPMVYRQGCNQLAKAVKKYDSETGMKGKDDYLMDIFIDTIKKDYGEILTNKQQRNALSFVKRSLEKKQYQQALTFIESLMPQYFFEKKGVITQSVDRTIFYQDENQPADIYKAKKIDAEIEKDIDMMAKIDGFKDAYNFLFDEFNYRVVCRSEVSSNEKDTKRIIKEFSKERECTLQTASVFGEPIVLNLIRAHSKMNNKKKKKKIIKAYDKHESYLKDRYKNLSIKAIKSIELKFWFDGGNKEKQIVNFLCLHYHLKKCRNQMNHSSEKSHLRPETEDIINCLKLYVEYAEDLLERE